jgi:hypothetical protein
MVNIGGGTKLLEVFGLLGRHTMLFCTNVLEELLHL